MADAAVDLGTSETPSMFDTPAAETPAAEPSISPSTPAGTLAPATTPPTTSRVPGAEVPEAPIDPIKALEDLLTDEFGPKPQPETQQPDLQKLLEGLTPETPAYKRIQQLANLNNNVRGQYQAMQGQMAQMQSAVEQTQQWAQQAIGSRDQVIQALQANLQALTSRMQAMAATPPQVQPQQPTDPAQQLEQQWLQKMQGVMSRQIAESLKPLQERNQLLEQSLAAITNQNKQAELQKTSEQYRTEALTTVRDIVLKNVDVSGMPAENLRALANGLSAQVLSLMMHNNIGPQEAAALVRQQYLQASALFARAASAQFAARRKQAASEAVPNTQRRSAGAGTGIPPPEQLAKMGYHNELEYISAQQLGEG